MIGVWPTPIDGIVIYFGEVGGTLYWATTAGLCLTDDGAATTATDLTENDNFGGFGSLE
jgi:hypothetical protein